LNFLVESAGDRMREKEASMIELTEAQARSLNTPEQPPLVVDPLTGQQYRLVKEEIFKLMQSLVKPFNRSWDNPADDDLIRKDV
jgi:hypothetical protein